MLLLCSDYHSLPQASYQDLQDWRDEVDSDVAEEESEHVPIRLDILGLVGKQRKVARPNLEALERSGISPDQGLLSMYTKPIHHSH